MVVEDLHWADHSTLDLAAFLVRALHGVPVLLVLTYRSDELHRRRRYAAGSTSTVVTRDGGGTGRPSSMRPAT